MMPMELFERFNGREAIVLRLGTKLHQNDVTDEMYFMLIDSI